MTRSEFLRKLREALENDLSGSIVTENVRYYEDYIRDEVRRGRQEEDVIGELGDPWVIAQTIIDSAEENIGKDYQRTNTYETQKEYRYEDQQQSPDGGMHVFAFDTWWKRLLFWLAIAGVIFLVGSVAFGLLSIFAPFIVPMLIVIAVVNLLGRGR